MLPFQVVGQENDVEPVFRKLKMPKWYLSVRRVLPRVTEANLFLMRHISILAISDGEKAERCVRESRAQDRRRRAHPSDVTLASTSVFILTSLFLSMSAILEEIIQKVEIRYGFPKKCTTLF